MRAKSQTMSTSNNYRATERKRNNRMRTERYKMRLFTYLHAETKNQVIAIQIKDMRNVKSRVEECIPLPAPLSANNQTATINYSLSRPRADSFTQSGGFSHKKYTFWVCQPSDSGQISMLKFQRRRIAMERISAYARVCPSQPDIVNEGWVRDLSKTAASPDREGLAG